jgi:AsmA protein
MMKQRRLGRKLFLLLLGLLGLIILILAILPYVISLDSVKGQIVAQAEEALQRKVDIGQVRLQILTGLGAGLEQLTIHNPPGWQQPYFVKVGTLAVKVAFLPLLRRKIEIRKIILSNGDIFLERNAKGLMNYADLIQPGPKAGKPAPSPPTGDTTPEVSPLAALLVSKVSLQHVNITFIDHKVVPGQTLTTTARDVQVDISNVALNTPIDFDISTALLTDGGHNVRLYGRLGPIPETLAFDRTPIHLTLQAKDISLGKLAPYMGPEPTLTKGQLATEITIQGSLASNLGINGTLSLAQGALRTTTGKEQALPQVTFTPNLTVNLAQALVQLTEVRFDLAPLHATLTGTVRNLTATPQFDVQLATNNFSLGEVLAQFPMLAAALPTPTAIQGRLQLQGAAKGTPSNLRADTRLTVDSLSLKSGTFSGAKAQGGMRFETTKMHATLRAELVPPRPPDVRLDLRAERLVFDQEAATAATPKQKASTKPPPQPTVPSLNLRGTVAIAEGRIKQMQFQKMAADLSLINGLLKSTQTFTMYGGTFQGLVQVNLAQAEPDYTLKVKLANVNVGNLANELTSVKNVLFGVLSTNFEFSGRGFTWPTISKTLTGTAKAQITDLKLTTLNLMPKLALGLQGVSRLAGFPIPAGLSNRSFNTLQGSFRIARGKLRTEDLTLRGKQVEVRAKGLLGLDQSLNFEGTVFLLGSLAAAFGKRAAFLQDKQGRVQLPFAVHGTVTKPRIALNKTYLTRLMKRSLARKVEEKASQELQKLLPQALSGKPAQRAPTETGSGKKETPQERLKKTFKRLFKR